MKNFTIEQNGLSEKDILDFLAKKIRLIHKPGTKVISLVAGEAAGSTTLADKLANRLSAAEVISTDDALIGDRLFRRTNLEGQDPLKKYDTSLLRIKVNQIKDLKEGEYVKIPEYDAASGMASSVGEKRYKRKIGKIDYLIVEGAVHFIKNTDLLIFMDVPENVRLANRVSRGIAQRNEKSIPEVKKNFKLRQTAEYQSHVLPIASKADIYLKINASPKRDGYSYKYSIYLKKENKKD